MCKKRTFFILEFEDNESASHLRFLKFLLLIFTHKKESNKVTNNVTL